VRPPHGRQLGVPLATDIRDPWHGGHGVAPAQGTLQLAAGTKVVEQDIGHYPKDYGLRANPAWGGRLGQGGNVPLVGVYVNDLIITGSKDEDVGEF
jgi:hypothetical protein